MNSSFSEGEKTTNKNGDRTKLPNKKSGFFPDLKREGVVCLPRTFSTTPAKVMEVGVVW